MEELYEYCNPLQLHTLSTPNECLHPEMTFTENFNVTRTGSLISSKSKIYNPDKIFLSGRSIVGPYTILRGDIAPIRVGKYVIINPSVILHPSLHRNILNKSKQTPEPSDPTVISSKQFMSRFLTMTIQDNVFIGSNSVIKSALIEKKVWIGENCVVGQGTVLNQCCLILPNSYLPDGTVVPSYTIYGGNPALFISPLTESFEMVLKDLCAYAYKKSSGKLDMDGWPVPSD